MRLVYRKNGVEVKVGDTVEINKEYFKIAYFAKPSSSNSSGKITVRDFEDEGAIGREYYVGVVGAIWINREDQL